MTEYEEPTPISIKCDGRTIDGEYVIDERDDGVTYLIVTSDGLGVEEGVLGDLEVEWLARDLLRTLARKRGL